MKRTSEPPWITALLCLLLRIVFRLVTLLSIFFLIPEALKASASSSLRPCGQMIRGKADQVPWAGEGTASDVERSEIPCCLRRSRTAQSTLPAGTSPALFGPPTSSLARGRRQKRAGVRSVFQCLCIPVLGTSRFGRGSRGSMDCAHLTVRSSRCRHRRCFQSTQCDLQQAAAAATEQQ